MRLDPKHKSSYLARMNKLPLARRIQILAMLCEGSSMRSISRVVDVSINTVSKLLVEAGEACLKLHDETVRDVKASVNRRGMLTPYRLPTLALTHF